MTDPTPLEYELRAITDLQTASKIARAVRREYGVTTREGLAHLYHTKPKMLRNTHQIGDKRFQVIEKLILGQVETEIPAERIATLEALYE